MGGRSLTVAARSACGGPGGGRGELLASLPRGNAVTFDYTPEHRRGEDFHLSDANLLSIAVEPTPSSAGHLADEGIGPT